MWRLGARGPRLMGRAGDRWARMVEVVVMVVVVVVCCGMGEEVADPSLWVQAREYRRSGPEALEDLSCSSL